jgi:hypothetical protein
MAQEIAVQGTLASRNELSGLSGNQRYQIEQYKKIVRLRDAILSGQHPTIKPSNLNTSANSSIQPIDVSSSHGASKNQSDKRQQVGISAPASSSTAKNSKPYGAGSTEIYPIFLVNLFCCASLSLFLLLFCSLSLRSFRHSLASLFILSKSKTYEPISEKKHRQFYLKESFGNMPSPRIAFYPHGFTESVS